MALPRAQDMGRIVTVNAYVAGLMLVALYVRHWIVLVLWFGLLLGVPLGMVVRRRGREIAALSFLGWLILGAAIGITVGQPTWAGFVVMAIVGVNYMAYDWDRPPPAPSKPSDPAFKDPVFASAASVVLVSGILVVLTVAGLIPDFWLGPFCGATGFGLALLVIAIARWQISTR